MKNAKDGRVASLMKDYAPPDIAEIENLERDVHRQLKAPHEKHLKILGYGEFTIAVAHPKESPKWACKRLPPSDQRSAERFKAHIERYVGLLEGVGVRVVPTTMHIVPAAGGEFALYLSQPILPAQSLAPAVLHTREPNEDDEVLVSIIQTICKTTTAKFGADAHVANWAWLNNEPWYFDISTPFTQGADDQPELDVGLLVKPYPAITRPLLLWLVAPSKLLRYYNLRTTLLEFAGMLHKEGLRHWIPATVALSNRYLEKPISLEEVEKFYADEVALWDLIYNMKRVERRIKSFMGQTYQFLISPPIDRYGVKQQVEDVKR